MINTKTCNLVKTMTLSAAWDIVKVTDRECLKQKAECGRNTQTLKYSVYICVSVCINVFLTN